MKRRQPASAEARFSLLCSQWAQQIGLPPGNLWEPALLRYLLSEYARLGGDANAWAFVTALTKHRLGLGADRPSEPSPDARSGG